MAMFSQQSAAAQTAYAGMAQAARQHGFRRTIADLPGSFVKKKIKGRDYWYYQHKLPGGSLSRPMWALMTRIHMSDGAQRQPSS